MKITWLGWDYDRFPVDAKRRINVQTHTRELFGQDVLDQLGAIEAYTNMELVSIPPRPRLSRPAHRRRKDHPGDPPLPQALHRPRALPAPHPDDESSRGSLQT